MADESWLAFASLIVVMGPWRAGIVHPGVIPGLQSGGIAIGSWRG